MRFSDDNVNIRFYDRYDPEQRPVAFKAYLDKSDLQFKIEETQMVSGVSSQTTALTTRVLYEISLEFNVFSEDRDEAIDNYDKLHKLISMVKPIWRGTYNPIYIAGKKIDNVDFAIDASLNALPRNFLRFKGMPYILNGIYKERDPTTNEFVTIPNIEEDDLPIQFINFNYSIIKDMGYIQIPYENSAKINKIYSRGDMSLVPIGYKITATCRLIGPSALFQYVIYSESTPETAKFKRSKPLGRGSIEAGLETAKFKALTGGSTKSTAATASSAAGRGVSTATPTPIASRGLENIIKNCLSDQTATAYNLFNIRNDLMSKLIQKLRADPKIKLDITGWTPSDPGSSTSILQKHFQKIQKKIQDVVNLEPAAFDINADPACSWIKSPAQLSAAGVPISARKDIKQEVQVIIDAVHEVTKP